MLNRRSFFQRAAATLGAIAAGGVIAKQAEAAPKLIHGEVISTSKSISTATPITAQLLATPQVRVQNFGNQTLTVTGMPGANPIKLTSNAWRAAASDGGFTALSVGYKG